MMTIPRATRHAVSKLSPANRSACPVCTKAVSGFGAPVARSSAAATPDAAP